MRRFKLDCADGKVGLLEDEDGKYVLYADHLAHAQRDLELELKYCKAGEIAENLRDENTVLREQVLALEVWKADIEATFKMIMDEKCPPDEKHCTCVPFLRMKISMKY
jgi:hypothetical protein